MTVERKVSSDSEKAVSVKTVGFVVNPIAGMGGAVGLKGTDGAEILRQAFHLGAKPVAPLRAESFLSELRTAGLGIRFVVGAGSMGEYEAKNSGFSHTILGKQKKNTTAEDTKEIAHEMKDLGVDILVFCGGDGTARDILQEVGLKFPGLGV